MEADRWIMPDASFNKVHAGCPDLLVTFNADPWAYWGTNAYVIAEHGKPRDFVLVIASAATADKDTGHQLGL